MKERVRQREEDRKVFRMLTVVGVLLAVVVVGWGATYIMRVREKGQAHQESWRQYQARERAAEEAQEAAHRARAASSSEAPRRTAAPPQASNIRQSCGLCGGDGWAEDVDIQRAAQVGVVAVGPCPQCAAGRAMSRDMARQAQQAQREAQAAEQTYAEAAARQQQEQAFAEQQAAQMGNRQRIADLELRIAKWEQMRYDAELVLRSAERGDEGRAVDGGRIVSVGTTTVNTARANLQRIERQLVEMKGELANLRAQDAMDSR